MSEIVKKAICLYHEIKGIDASTIPSSVIYNGVLKAECEEITKNTLSVLVELIKKDDGNIYLDYSFKLGQSKLVDSLEIKSESDIISNGVLNFISDFERLN